MCVCVCAGFYHRGSPFVARRPPVLCLQQAERLNVASQGQRTLKQNKMASHVLVKPAVLAVCWTCVCGCRCVGVCIAAPGRRLGPAGSSSPHRIGRHRSRSLWRRLPSPVPEGKPSNVLARPLPGPRRPHVPQKEREPGPSARRSSAALAHCSL